ncbi:MAG TPA: tetratricopeptide repeat protein [Planctomycetota bacterium]|nr:tetratricopeptide repeat protein [Planctomycetota bacterium]
MTLSTSTMVKNRLLLASFSVVGAIACLGLGVPSASAQTKEDKDVVQLRDGKSASLSIESENWDAIVGKGSPPISWDNVQAISYANAPEFTKAIDAFNAGNYDSALTQFEALKEDAKLRKVFKQQIAFDTALALAENDKVDEAIAAYQDVLKTYPKGRYHVRAVDGIANGLIAKNDTAGAMKAVDAATADAGDPALATAIGLVKARLLVAQNKYAEAKPLFVAASSAQGAPASVGFEGQLGQATCLFQEGNAAGAETAFRSLTKVDAPKHVLAGAWNGLGDILSDQGRKKKDIDQLLDALYCYLRGTTVYAPLAGESGLQYERALAGSALCFGYVSDLEPNKDRKKLYSDRANERKELLKKEFPTSPFLKLLR